MKHLRHVQLYITLNKTYSTLAVCCVILNGVKIPGFLMTHYKCKNILIRKKRSFDRRSCKIANDSCKKWDETDVIS